MHPLPALHQPPLFRHLPLFSIPPILPNLFFKSLIPPPALAVVVEAILMAVVAVAKVVSELLYLEKIRVRGL